MDDKIILITQARIGSSRLNSKVLKEINGQSLLEIQLSRIKRCKSIDQIVVATPDGEAEIPIHEICKKLGVDFFRGSENNVLERYYQAGLKYNADWIVRITSDCPLIDPFLIDEIIFNVISGDKDYGSNTMIDSFPDGQDIEVFKFDVLKDARSKAILKSDREHVTPFIKRNSDKNSGNLYTAASIVCKSDFSRIRMTVDEIADFDAIQLLVQELGINAGWEEYTDYIIRNSDDFSNQSIIRNEGYLKSINED
jgi:spore coat polysaccharide biosynthesis protein SpsF